MSAFGERIKTIRSALGLNQEEFGGLIGITGPAVAQYEAGRRHPDYKVLAKLLEVFHVKHKLLFEDDPTIHVLNLNEKE